MFGTAFCHLLPDAIELFDDEDVSDSLGLGEDFPLAETIFLVSALLMVFVDVATGRHNHDDGDSSNSDSSEKGAFSQSTGAGENSALLTRNFTSTLGEKLIKEERSKHCTPLR